MPTLTVKVGIGTLGPPSTTPTFGRYQRSEPDLNQVSYCPSQV